MGNYNRIFIYARKWFGRVPVEKLCYIGKRGMGALEYEPALENAIDKDSDLDIDTLTKLVSKILSKRENMKIVCDSNMLTQLMEGSSSVGGARAKTLIALNET